eukprot:TRINITY_DN2717_c1_g4_i1.p2 TRINITY_DN2717_c1_g4~~TRINITY_DN2717_c1_g4_i1.p2  ORF type:complete len:131 (+),score=65.21 TRINITY_DN2717_c1_g4_i1:88-480(+)
MAIKKMAQGRFGKKSVFSAEEKARYEEIAAAVKAAKGIDAAKALARMAAATAVAQSEDAEETFDEKSKDFVGVMLDGCGGNTPSKGELTVDTSDVKVEEPPVIVDDVEEEGELRELWGDGDKNPNEEADE